MIRKQWGVTLLELLITLSLVITLSAMAVPAYRAFIERNRASATTSAVLRTLQFARKEAVARQHPVVICGSNDGRRCRKQWTEYLLVFVDTNNDRKPAAEEILQARHLKLAHSTITTSVSFGAKHSVFNPDGSSGLAGSLVYCPDSEEKRYARRITWNRSGRPYLGRDLDGDGVVEGTNNRPLKCK